MFSSVYGFLFAPGSERSPSDRCSEAGNDEAVVIDFERGRAPSVSGSHTSDNAAADFSSRIRRLISTLEEASKQGGEQYAQRVRERQHGVGTVGSLAAYPGQQVERGIPRIPLGQLGEELRSAELAALNDSARIGSSPRKAEISQRSRLPSIDDANALKIESPSSSELSDDGWHGEGMVVTFKELNYTVKHSSGKRRQIRLLTDVSGYLRPGELAALMGPSGSSKTTLLDVLAGRKTVGKIEGTIAYGGHRPTKSFLRRYTGYVEQFDTLLANLTVQEMLLYTCQLKAPLTDSFQQKKARVNEIIEELGLTGCRSVLIGHSLAKGISGGQCKRVNIGLALVTRPYVLFLDEPTSGLDSYTSNEVMGLVKGLAEKGMTVCATIHNPTRYCFDLFDRLMVLLRGHVIYSGPQGDLAIEYFESIPAEKGGSQTPEELHNAAEWIVDFTTRADREGRSGLLAEWYNESKLKEANLHTVAVAESMAFNMSMRTSQHKRKQPSTANPAYWGFYILLRYRALKDFRDMAFWGPRIADKLFLCAIIVSLYWAIGLRGGLANYNNIVSVLFLWTILPGYAASSYMPSLVLERPLYVRHVKGSLGNGRERNDGLYRPVTYLAYKIFEEMVVVFLNSVVFSALVFFTLRLKGSFVFFWLVYLVTSSVGIVVAYFIASVSSTMDAANAALPAYITSLLLFVGLLIRKNDQPVWWRWYSNVDFLHYAWVAQMINQFGDDELKVLAGMTTLQFYNIYDNNKWKMLGFEALFFIAFLLFAWLALAFCRHAKR